MKNPLYILLIPISFGCDYFFNDTIDLAGSNYKDIGNLTVGEIIEIQFDLMFPSPCTSDYCTILKVEDQIQDPNVTAPGILIPKVLNKTMRMQFSTASNLNAAHNFYDVNVENTMYDGTFHTWYFKWTPTERILTFDGTSYINTTNGVYDSSQYYGKRYRIMEGGGTDAQIRNLCINVSWYADTHPNSCNLYLKNPIKIVENNIMDTIILDEIMELSFDLQIKTNWTCPSGWCNFLRISPSNAGAPRLPMLAIQPNDTGFHSAFSLKALDYKHTYLLHTINDGSFHHLFLKYSYTQRLFIFDGILMGNMTNNNDISWDISSYIGTEYTLWMSRATGHQVPPAWIKNLCIRLYRNTDSPTTLIPTTTPTLFTKDPTTNPTIL
eukprot:205404_1